MTRRNRIVAGAAALAFVLPVAAQAQASDPAAARIEAYDNGVIAIMKAKLSSTSARADRFEPLVKTYYDMPGIAALVVGPAWSGASASDKSAAIAALTRHSAVSLARNFKDYANERFTVSPQAIAHGSEKVVKVTIDSDTLFYRMRQAGGTWKIVDVISGGVSNLSLQRADLQATVQGGGVPALVRKLGQLDAEKSK